MDIEEGGYKDWAVDVEPGDANSFPTEDAIEHVYVVVTDKDSGEVYEGRLFLAEAARQPAEPPEQSETPAKVTKKCRHGLPTTYKGQKVGCGICDKEREEQSRQLIRQLRQEQRGRLFKHHSYMKTFVRGDE